MVIEVTYNVTDVYMSTTVSPIYITVDYSGSGGGGSSVWGAITGTLSNQTDLQTALDGKFDDPTGTSLQYIDGTGAVQTFPLTLPVLQEVRNQTGSTLAAGTVVYINGATGNKPTVTKAIATGDSTSAQTLGMIQSAIANNGTGYVIVIGTCSALDTSAYTEGQQLYLSGTTAGGVTTTKPYAPIHLVYVGIVTRSHPTLGTIEVRVMNGFEISELHDVDALNPSNNDGIFYNSGNSLWEHKPISTVLGYTPEQPLTFSSPLSRSTNTVSIPVASSSANGYLSSTDWSTFNAKGSGTVTSVSALTLGTTGTDVSSTVANGTTTPVITLNIPTASATNRGALSSTDWSTFNSKQGALTLTTTGTSGAATLVGSTLNIPQYSGGGGMAIGGSITSATAGSVLFAGTSGVLAQDNTNLFWDDTNNRLGIRTTSPNAALHVSGSTTASGAIARGSNFTSTLVASANNDVLIGLDVAPTFTNGAFTGVTNYAARFSDNLIVSKNQNLVTDIIVSNTTNGTGSYARFKAINNNLQEAQVLITSSSWTAYGALGASTGGYYTNATNGLALLADSNAPIRFLTGIGSANTEKIRIFGATGNLAINSTTDSGERLQVTGTAKITGNTKIGNTVFNDPASNLIVGIDGTAARGVIANNFSYQDFMFVNTSIAAGNINNWSFGQRRDTLFGNTIGSFQIAGAYVDNNGTFSMVGGGYLVPLICNPNGDVLINGGNANVVNGLIGLKVNAPTAHVDITASTTSNASLRIRSGTAPTSPNNGDIWFDGTDIKMRIGGVTKTFTLI